MADLSTKENRETTVSHVGYKEGRRSEGCVNLTQFDTVFCDSLAALDAAYANGLERSATVLTRSPALVARDDLPCVHLDTRDGFDSNVLENFYLTTTSFLEACRNDLKSDPATEPFAVLFCRVAWIWQMRAAFAAFLNDEDFEAPRLVVEGVPNPEMPERYLLPWRKWLAGNPELGIFRTDTVLPGGWPAEMETLSFRDRIRLQGIEQVLFRLSTIAGRFVPSSLTRGQVYYLRESELVRDACAEFAKRGFGVKRFEFPLAVSQSGQHPMCARAVERIRGHLDERLAQYFPARAAPSLLAELLSTFSRELFAYDSAKSHLRDNASKIFRKNKVIILTNYPFGGDQLALVHAADERGAVFAGVQHGVGRELLEVRHNQCNYENTFSKNVVVFNEEARRITASGAFRSPGGDVCVAGGLADFRRVQTRSRTDGRIPPILYAQMLGQTGSFFNGSIYKDDVASSRRDISLITQVFEHLPHAVGFKCYPHRSYEDIDPALNVARTARNVSLLHTGQDLRYLISQTKVVISVGASSTLAWCLGAGCPVIYIDPVSAGYRIHKNIMRDCADAFFYFDERDDEYLQKMRVFLSRSLDDIQREWKKGEKPRREFFNRFFGTVDNRSGKKIADWLLSKVPS